MQKHIPVALAVLGLGLGLGLTAGTAHADLDINGAVGLPLNPTAELPAQNSGRIQGNYFDLGSAGGSRFKDYSAVGAFSAGKGLEINGGYNALNQKPNTGFDRKGFDLGAKYVFNQLPSVSGLNFAVGGGFSHSLGRDTYFYAVASKSLKTETAGLMPIRLSLGVRNDNFKLVSSKKTSVYAGAEVPLAAAGRFQAVGEIGTKNVNQGRTPFSASIRYRPLGSPLGVSVGYAREGLTTRDGIFASVGYNFGPK